MGLWFDVPSDTIKITTSLWCTSFFMRVDPRSTKSLSSTSQFVHLSRNTCKNGVVMVDLVSIRERWCGKELAK